ncbi:MAG: glutamyl-tRNA reductase [Deltaproteobacteria bacterium]|nr:glutamyl-tRNA reductase [Deltaproteobacteria bacterium]
MHILVFGLNHKTAPLEIREKFYISEEKIGEFITYVKEKGIKEFVILSTCNRTEFYLFSETPDLDLKNLEKALLEHLNIKHNWVKEYTYTLHDEDAYRHLLSVASGLDSMVIGEPQILGQVKDAYRAATFYNSTGLLSNRIFHRAFNVAKKIRTETKIGYNPVSISSMAVEMAKRIFGDLREKKILTIGAGEMTKIALKNFKREGIKKIYVLNRTFANAKKLAEEIVGEAYPIEELERFLSEVDLILTSTGAEDFVLKRDSMLRAMKTRKFKPLFIIDIAVPRDVDPSVSHIENVYLYNIDDLKELSQKHFVNRMREAEKAKEIVEEEVQKLPLLIKQMDTKPLILHIIETIETMRKEELKKAFNRMKYLDEDTKQNIENLTRAIVRKIIHSHIELIRKNGSYEVLETLKLLFKFEDTNEERDSSRDKG